MNRNQKANVRRLYETHIKNLALGETKSCNHEGCEAGEDTRQRLYFSRAPQEPRRVLYFCQNCQDGGSFLTRTTVSQLAGAPVTERGFQQPGVGINNTVRQRWASSEALSHELITKLPRMHRDWLNRWRTATDETRGLLRWDASSQELVMPIYSRIIKVHDGYAVPEHPSVLQMRRHQHPRYYRETEAHAVTGNNMYTLIKQPNAPTLCVVEDLLSGLSVVEHSDWSVLVLYGTHVPLEVLHTLKKTEEFKNAVVWLDNDNTVVREHASLIAGRMKNLGYNLWLEPARSAEPKGLTKQGLTNMIHKINKELK